jgi:perosamine synthetase
VHLAVAALNPNPGDEFVTTSITDMGALTPILYQGGIPVFAEVDPVTLNLTAKTIEAALSPRTKAIIVTHLFGNPCDMNEIMELARARKIPVIEDCAQAFLARSGNQYVGTFGAIGCFSTQQGKHMTTGEGGFVVSNDDALARHMFLFINKAWGYGDPNPDHYFLALNYRTSELHSAVALAQLDKLQSVVDRRVETANQLTRMLSGVRGIKTPKVASNAVHVYWKYCLTVDGKQIRDGAVGLGKALKEFGIASAPRYIQKPAFMCEIFQKRRTLGDSQFPFNLARPDAVDYSKSKFPMTFKALEDVLVLPWNERYTQEHLDFIADAVKESVEQLAI